MARAGVTRFAVVAVAVPLLAVGAVAFLLARRDQPATHESDVPEAAEGGRQSVHALTGTAHIFVGEGHGLAVSVWPRAIRLLATERNPTTLDFDEYEWTESTSYAPWRAVARHGNDAIVWGRRLESTPFEDVIERWEIEAVTGAYVSTRTIAPNPIGESSPEGVVSSWIEGGVYVAPALRPVPYVERFELFRGSQFGGIRDLVVDPDGRYVLLIADGTSSIVSLSLSADAAPVTIASASTCPHLALANMLHFYLHLTEGRKVVAEWGDDDIDATNRTLLSDANNDGLFESIETLSAAQWEARGYLKNVWLKDYIIVN